MRSLTLPAVTFVSAVAAGFLELPVALAAQSVACTESSAEWVQFSIDEQSNSPLSNKLLELLRVELEPRQISVCTEATSPTRPPIATIRIVHSASSTVGIEVLVDDAITNKKVMRQLDLRSLPPDTHATAIALGAAELLRASWAEVNLRSSNPPSRPVPESVKKTLADEDVRIPKRASLGVYVAGEEFAHGLVQGGVDARISVEVQRPIGIMVRAGVRQVRPVQARDGRVQADAWHLGVGGSMRLTPLDSSASLDLVGRVDLFQLHFLAEPHAGADSNSGSATAVTAGAGISGALLTSTSAQFEAEVVAGGVIKGVRATDTGKEVVALNGAWVGGSLGMSVRFW